MILRIVQAATVFNWVEPLIGLVEDIYHDPTLFQTNSWTFFFSYDEALATGWNAKAIEAMLQANGVKLWGRQMSGNTYFFNVSLAQAQWADYLLAGYGIPIQPRSMGAPKPKVRQRGRVIRPQPRPVLTLNPRPVVASSQPTPAMGLFQLLAEV